jgi:hypothetical protein
MRRRLLLLLLLRAIGICANLNATPEVSNSS